MSVTGASRRAIERRAIVPARCGPTFADVVWSHVFLVGDPRNNGEIDFAGLNASFGKFLRPRLRVAEDPTHYRRIKCGRHVHPLANDAGLQIQVGYVLMLAYS